MRRRVRAERFRLAWKLESRPWLCPVGCEPNGHRMRRRPQTWRKLPFPRTPGPRACSRNAAGEGCPEGQSYADPSGGRGNPAFGGRGGKPPAGETRGPIIFPPGRSAWGLGSRRRGRGGRPAPGAPLPLPTLPPVLVPSIPRGRGPRRSPGPARPVTWDGPGRLPEHPGGSTAPGGGAQPARGAGKVTWRWFQVAEAAA